MRPKSDKLSWDQDGKTAQAPSSYSQQRIKAVKPKMSWGEDACTVARPADAELPADAFRPDLVETHEAIDVEVSEAVPRAQPAALRHPWRRWLLVAVTIPAFYVLSYTAVRVAQKLQQHPDGAARTGSAAAQIWGAVREVLHEAVDGLSKRSDAP